MNAIRAVVACLFAVTMPALLVGFLGWTTGHWGVAVLIFAVALPGVVGGAVELYHDA